MREVPCPQCREVLGVPPEFERGPIRCGNCGRVIDPREHSPYQNAGPPVVPPSRRYDPDARDPNDDGSRNRRLDADDDTPSRRGRAPGKPPSRGGRRWVLGLLGGLAAMAFLCCGCGGVVVWQVAQPHWAPFVTQDFTAEFPNPPTYESQAVPRGDGTSTTLHQYATVMPFQQQVVLVQYADLPKGAEVGRLWREMQLNAMLDELKKSTSFGFVETARRSATMAGQPAREVEGNGTHPQLGTGVMTVRTAIVGKRVYVLVAMGRDRGKLDPIKTRFFDSFTVPGADPKPVEKDKDKPADKEKDKGE